MSTDTCEQFTFKPIGVLRSWYKTKNATPRQGSILPESKGVIELNKTFFDKPYLSLEGLDKFSHVWILFYFHENTNKKVRSKIKPPRLNGQSTGLFSTRSPHRPNAIGLSLSKIDKIEHNFLHVSGIDILDQTPILDIKPYIYEYDHPKSILDKSPEVNASNSISNETSLNEMNEIISQPDWIARPGVVYDSMVNSSKQITDLNKIDKSTINQLKVSFTERSERQLRLFHSKNSDNHHSNHLIKDLKSLKNLYLNYKKDCTDAKSNEEIDEQSSRDANDELADINKKDNSESYSEMPFKIKLNSGEKDGQIKCKYCFEYLNSVEEAKSAILNTLIADPRSSYRRKKCSDRLYFFSLDTMHVSTWFDEEDGVVEVVKIKPNYLCEN